MHRTIGAISKRFVHIKSGEGRKVLLTFLYFFLVITAYYIIKPVSRSLMLGDLGSRVVPYADLLSAILMGPLVGYFARLVDRVERHRLVGLAFLATTVSLVVFWFCMAWPTKWLSAAFYLWVSMFSVLVVTLFWLVANDLYHPREAKRLFGFIGSGGILGGIVGSSIAAAGARLFGTPQLLLCSAAILAACWAVVERLWPYELPEAKASRQTPHPAIRPNLGGIVQLVRSSRYLLLLVGLVGIAKIISTLIYYQFNPFLEQMFPDQDAKTAFTGLFFGWLNVASFAIQFFFTSWVLRRLGLATALLAVPIGLLGASVGLLAVPVFWLAAATELYDGSMSYSLQQTAKEVLYLPIDRSIRYKIKPFIDMVIFRFGKGIAAILGIVLLDRLGLPARVLGYVTIPLIVLWIGLAIQLRYDYVKSIRDILQARAASRRTRELQALAQQRGVSREGERVEAWLESLSPTHLVQQKLSFAGQLFSHDGLLLEDAKQLMEALAAYEQRTGHPEGERVAWTWDQAKACLQDRHEPMAKRRQAIKYLVQQNGQDAVDCLVGMLLVEQDVMLRRDIIRGLAKLRFRHPRLEFPKKLIKRQIEKEVEVYQRALQIVAIYRRVREGSPKDGDPVMGLLRMIVDEAHQEVFRLLSLLYRPDDIFLVYNQLREPDAYLRADAIELLDNLIDPGLKWAICPVLDEDAFLERLNGYADEPLPDANTMVALLRQGLWDHNRWLSLVIMSVIVRLRLEGLRPELERAAGSGDPLLQQAARAATHLASSTTTS